MPTFAAIIVVLNVYHKLGKLVK